MSERNDLLFVYGTLLTRARGELGADMRARLKKVSSSLGEATIPGRLFDLGTFPVMIAAAAPSDVVHGEVLQLDDPESTFVWLDPYEGITPGHRRQDEYERVLSRIEIEELHATATDKVRERGHDRLPTFAAGRDLSRPAWAAVFRQMMGRDLLRPDPGRHGALRMTEAAKPVLRGEESVTLRQDTVAAATAAPAVRALVAEDDAALLSLLKAKRRALAEAQGMPAYIVFPDRTLIEMAERRPATLDAMAGITGVGAKKLQSYGAAFLEVITGAASAPIHPARMRLAGRDAGALFDRLAEVQLALARGGDGTGTPLSSTPATLRHVAEARPSTLAELGRMPGMSAARLDRFGAAFLAVIADG